MREVILNDKYKYVYDSKNKLWRIHINGVPTPLKPEKAYKFYNTNLNNIASLHDGYFWLSNPADFNDPFDCNLNLLDHEDNAINKLDPLKKRNDISNIGVTCFTEIINEPLLWAHYTNNYRGFVIEFNTETIRVKMEENERLHSFNPVLYFNKFIRVKNTDKFAMEYLLTAKSDRWIYEKEWRFIATVDETKPYDRILFYEPIAIKALYIGHKLFDEQESVFNLIESIFSSKYPEKPIYIVNPHPYKLELLFQCINENNK